MEGAKLFIHDPLAFCVLCGEFFPRLKSFGGQHNYLKEKRNNETPCRGSIKLSLILPFLDFNQRGDVSKCNCPAAFSAAYCCGDGSCGESIACQAVKELLVFRSTRKCSSKTRSALCGSPSMVRRTCAGEPANSSSS